MHQITEEEYELLKNYKKHLDLPEDIEKALLKELELLIQKYYKKGYLLTVIKGAFEVRKIENKKIEPKILESKVTYSGDTCFRCGGMMRDNGTCKMCTNCGETTGCS